TDRDRPARYHDRIAEGGDVAEQRMMFHHDLSTRREVRIVLDLVETQCGTHRDVGVDRDLHPLCLGTRVEHALDLVPEFVLATGKVDDEIVAMRAEQILAADCATPIAPELRLD